MIVSFFVLSFFPRGVLDEILNFIESVSEGFPPYSLTGKLLHQGYRYHKPRKAFFFKFYRRHYELVLKFKVGLKSLLQQALSKPEFNGDLVYKWRKLLVGLIFLINLKK